MLENLIWFGAGFGACLLLCFAWYHGHLKQQIDDLKTHVTSSVSSDAAAVKQKILDAVTAALK